MSISTLAAALWFVAAQPKLHTVLDVIAGILMVATPAVPPVLLVWLLTRPQVRTLFTRRAPHE